MTGCIAVLNAGSSSIKFALYEAGRDGALLFHGQVENIGLAAHLAVTDASGATVAERRWSKGELDHQGATAEILKLGRELLAGRPVLAIGHRVVHGGTEFAAPVRVDAGVMAALEKLVPLAPLHQPHNLAPIKFIADGGARTSRRSPASTPRSTVPSRRWRRRSPCRASLTAAGVRRYGFHGLSYEYIVSRLARNRPGPGAGPPGHRPSRQRRQPVRRRAGPQRRQHHGLHRRRRPDDGHALRARSIPACCST